MTAVNKKWPQAVLGAVVALEGECVILETSTRKSPVYLLDVMKGKKMYDVEVDQMGKSLVTATKEERPTKKVAVAELPKAVVEAVEKAMPGSTITSASKGMQGGIAMYQLDVKKGDKTAKYTVDLVNFRLETVDHDGLEL